MADDKDDSQKTEDPTQRRIEEAIKKGQVAFSREVTNFLIIIGLLAIISWMAPYILEKGAAKFRFLIENSHQVSFGEDALRGLAVRLILDSMALIAGPLALIIILVFSSSFLQNGRVIFSTEPIIPKLEKISIIQGFKRLFSLKSIIEFAKGVIKIFIVGIIGWIAIKSDFVRLHKLHEVPIIGIMQYLLDVSKHLVIGSACVMAVLAVLDFLYQKFEYIKSLRMSKQDIKEEYRETEGSPEIKAKIKALRSDRAKKRMISAVPDSDVVITNPTHYAVALKYDPDKYEAPVVVAKGLNKIALKIREVATANDVTIYENPPLARSLYESTDISETIPTKHYQAVAEIISYVYSLKKGRG